MIFQITASMAEILREWNSIISCDIVSYQKLTLTYIGYVSIKFVVAYFKLNLSMIIDPTLDETSWDWTQDLGFWRKATSPWRTMWISWAMLSRQVTRLSQCHHKRWSLNHLLHLNYLLVTEHTLKIYQLKSMPLKLVMGFMANE